MPEAINLTLVEDDTGQATYQLTAGATPLDLTSATVTAVVKTTQHVEDTDPLAYLLETGNGVTITDAASGTVRLTFPAEVMASPSTWFYKIRVTIDTATRTAVWGWLTVMDT